MDLIRCVLLKVCSHRITGSETCQFARIPVYTSANGTEGDAGAAILLGDPEALPVAALQERLAHPRAAVDGADGVDNVLGGEVVSAGDDGLAGVAAVWILCDAFAHELRAGGGVDGAVDTAPATEGGVCGVDDGVYGEGGEVCADEADAVVDCFIGGDLVRGSVLP